MTAQALAKKKRARPNFESFLEFENLLQSTYGRANHWPSTAVSPDRRIAISWDPDAPWKTSKKLNVLYWGTLV